MNKLILFFTFLLSWFGIKPEETERLAGIKVPEGYEVEVAAGPDLVDFPMFGTVDEYGRLFLFESTGNVYNETEDALKNPQFRIRLLVDENGDGKYDKSTVFADSLSFPQGGVFYKGSLYATVSPDYIKFTDTDGDGKADKKEKLLTGFTLNVNANSLVGPFMSPDGWLYMTNAIMGFNVKTKEGEQLKGGTARVWRLRPDGTQLQWVSAGGMNNPVEITFTESAEPIGTQTYFSESVAGLRDALMFWTEGGVYPKPNKNITRDKLPLTGELLPVVTKYSRVAPSGIWRYRNNTLGSQYTDNLFSAQFNTHRVLRHKLVRDGGGFKTEDETFFSKESDEDFHPTDVFEDGDGSLLVVETGGWFIKGCPLSQVSKPELQGAIYRIKKKGVKSVEDPFGKKVNWNTQSDLGLVKYLSDTRPFIQDKASESATERGNKIISVLLNNSKTVKAKIRAIFTLSKIKTPEALDAIKPFLSDPSLDVRISAAHSLGLEKYKPAISELSKMLLTDQSAGKRAAATALGRIADKSTINDLFKASMGVKDRFAEHAIIWALMQINEPKFTEKGLTSDNADIKFVSLTALDQMKATSLIASQVMPFLSSGNVKLRDRGLWVAGHHPEWAADLIPYIKNKLSKFPFSEKEGELVTRLLQSFLGQEVIQDFLAEEFKNSTEAKKIFLSKILGSYSSQKFPETWMKLLQSELSKNGQSEVKNELITIIKGRNIQEFAQELNAISNQEKLPSGLRINAISALKSDLSKIQFDFLKSQISEKVAAPTRQTALSVISSKKISDENLKEIAKDIFPHADAITLPRLLPLYSEVKDGETAKFVYDALKNFKGLDNIDENQVEKIFSIIGQNYKTELLNEIKKRKSERILYLNDLEKIAATGDIERGRKIFYGKAICSTCHSIGNEGGKFGPDLTSIQRDRSKHDLLEAIVYPSVSFVRLYETYEIKTASDTYSGIIKEQSPTGIELEIGPGALVKIQAKDIKSIKTTDTSMMPQGLDKILTKDELADLMTFLLGQDQDPEFDSELLRLKNKKH